jgi:hypothetical protein
MPFIDDDSEEEKRYIESSFALQKEEKQINPYGLAVAFLYSVPSNTAFILDIPTPRQYYHNLILFAETATAFGFIDKHNFFVIRIWNLGY